MTPGTATKPRSAPSSNLALDSPTPFGFPTHVQLSWPGGHRFSLDVVASIACTDDPGIEPGDGVPVDTIHLVGHGRLDGVFGATLSATLSDAGEPGTTDGLAYELRDASGALVFAFTGALSNGNHQARIQ